MHMFTFNHFHFLKLLLVSTCRCVWCLCLCQRLIQLKSYFSELFVHDDNSVLGGSLIITGLYAVTWASYRERQAAAGVIPHHSSKRVSESLHKTSFPRVNIFSGLSTKPSD